MNLERFDLYMTCDGDAGKVSVDGAQTCESAMQDETTASTLLSPVELPKSAFRPDPYHGIERGMLVRRARTVPGTIVAGIASVAEAAALAPLGWIAGLLCPSSDVMETHRHLTVGVLAALLYAAVNAVAGTARAQRPGGSLGLTVSAVGCWTAAVALVLAIGILWEGRLPFAANWTILWFALGAGTAVLSRLAIAQWTARRRATGRLATRIAVVGAGAQADDLVALLQRPEWRGEYEVVGLFDDEFVGHAVALGPRLGCLDDLASEAWALRVDVVMVAVPWSDTSRLSKICHRLRYVPADVCLWTDLSEYGLPCGRPRSLCGRSLLELWSRPLRDWRAAAKRAEDLVLGGLLLLLLAPLMCLIALAIVLDTPGPVLFRQRRFGLGNEPIEVFKFRTMAQDRGDVSGARATVKDDPRVTRVGRFLRPLSFDELPQLINVVRGDMSLVGPRAHPIEMRVEGEYYYEAVRSYAARHRVKPGITGLAQINGCRGLVDTRQKAQRRLDYDLDYIERWSLMLDFRIIGLTVFRVLADDDAY